MVEEEEKTRAMRWKEKAEPVEGRCQYLIPMKQRKCGQPVDKASQQFCRFHMSKVSLDFHAIV